MLTGKPLIDEIETTQMNKGELAFWWIGQHSFIVKMGPAVLYLDPFLSPFPSRMVPPLLKPEEVTNATFIFGSHDHADHIDRDVWPAMAKASPEARFVLPDLLINTISKDLGIPKDRMIGLDDGKSVETDGVRISAVAAAHELLDRDSASGQYPYLGFIIEANGCRIYHAGDTVKYEGLETRLKQWPDFDVVFLPINGRDAKRLASNCIGNMTYQEAVDLAGAINPRIAVPTHFEMFKQNSENPQNFVEYMNVKFKHLNPMVPQHGVRVVVPAK